MSFTITIRRECFHNDKIMFHVKHSLYLEYGHKIMFHVKQSNPIYCEQYRETSNFV